MSGFTAYELDLSGLENYPQDRQIQIARDRWKAQTRQVSKLLSDAHRYQIPGNYQCAEDLFTWFGFEISFRLGQARINPGIIEQDKAGRNLLISGFDIGLKSGVRPPLILVPEGLLQEFLLTEHPPGCLMEMSLPQGCFLLPKGKLFNPDGEEILAIAFRWLLAGHPLCLEDLAYIPSQPDLNRLCLGAICPKGSVYGSCIGFNPDTGEWDAGERAFALDEADRTTDLSSEGRFLNTLTSIVLQGLLFYSAYPELVTSVAADQVPKKPRGFGRTQRKNSNPQPPIYPRWLAAPDYASSTAKSPNPSQGTHASPRVHWRKGHWRRVAVGEGRTDRRWTWIRPVLVNSQIVQAD